MIKKIIGSFFLCCLNLGILWGQSNPIPFSLSQANYSLIQWPSASTAGTYPSAMKFHTCTTVNAGLTTPTSADYVGIYNGNSGARVNGLSSNGFYIAGVYNSTPTMGAAVLGLNSVGRGNINVSFQTSTILTGNPANVRLQYRIASNNNIWIDVPGPIEYVSNGSTSLNLTLYNLNLSALTSGDINDRPDFQLRWKYYRTSGSATNDCAIAIDEITVSSSPLPSPSIASGLAPAQQYCVTPTVGTPLVLNFSYNSSSSFTIGSNFIVELSNASGSFAVPIACGTALCDGTGSQNMNVTIPANTATGSGYRLRVKNSDNGVVGNDNGANIQVDLVPVVVTSVVPNARYRQVLLNWINPAFCWDEVMVVAREASIPSSSPTGNGSQYSANAQFALGSALGGGYVVYKGTGTSINITGLTPEISYGIVVWTRFGADWIAISPFSVMTPSIPVLSATPVIISQGEYFWNLDPGAGNGVAFSAEDGAYDRAFERIVKSGLTAPNKGQNILNVRVKDGAGLWSNVFSTVINVDSSDMHLGYSLTKLTQAEYWWDTDPGVGNASPVLALDGNLNAAFEGLVKNGLQAPHFGRSTFNIRVKDNSNNWSGKFTTIINVDSSDTHLGYPLSKLTQAEYWWDTDPGVGNASPVLALDGNLNAAFEELVKNGLQAPHFGRSTFNIRVKDNSNNWSEKFTTIINVDSSDTHLGYPLSKLTQAEYWWDTDPGVGNASPVLALDGNLNAAFEELVKNGLQAPHFGRSTFNIRVKDNSNNWSGKFTTIINVDSSDTHLGYSLTKLTQAEYWWDTDPGVGNASPVLALDGNLNAAFEELVKNGLQAPHFGRSTFNVRVKDNLNNWSGTFTTIINVDSTTFVGPLFTAQRIKQQEFYWDVDPGENNGTAMLPDDGYANSGFERFKVAGNYTQNLPNGVHILGTRTKDANGVWSAPFKTTVDVNFLGNTFAVYTNPAFAIRCQGQSVTLNALGGVSYSWAPSNGLNTTIGSTVIATPLETTTYSVVGVNSFGLTDTAYVTIQVNSPASIFGDAILDLCPGAYLELSSSSSFGNYWSTGATTQTISVTQGGTYTLVSENGCGINTSSVIVNMLSVTPPVIVADGPTQFCVGSGIGLSAGSGVEYLWSNGSTDPSIFVQETGSYSVTVTPDGGCPSTSQPISITASAVPNASITASGSTTICAGSFVTLTAPTGVNLTYQWLKNGLEISGASTNQFNVTASGFYNCIVSYLGCSSMSNMITVSTIQLPTAVITPVSSTTICLGGNVVLQGPTGSGFTYQWKLNNTSVSGATSSSYTASVAGNYTLIIASNGCFSGSSAITVSVISLPTANITVTGSLTFCQNGSVTLTASSGTGNTYQWYKNSIAIVGATNQVYTANGTGIYYVVVTRSSCSATSTTKTVVVNPLPVSNITPAGPTSFCSGGSVVLNATTGTGYSFQWKLNGINITGASGTSYTAIQAGNYALTVSASGCFATSSLIPVQVGEPITAVITAQGNTSFCSGNSVNLSANTGAGLTYQWKNDGTNILGATSSTYSATQTGNYTCVVGNNGCPTNSNTIAVNASSSFSVDITAQGSTNICLGGSVVLSTTPVNGYVYFWKFNGDTIPGAHQFEYAALLGGQYTLDVSYNNCIVGSNVITVVTGSPPSQPILTCYQTATFNTATCSWDVTGTQAASPTGLSCWQTASFSTSTCAWTIIGTQPVPPTLLCYQTASFNTTTCAWVVSGTQAAAPTGLSCWQTAAFNTTICAWDVTGTQAAQPTLACYQTAAFNTTSCAWDVTGTQQVLPTVACYETPTFNTTTCVWDVTGTQPVEPTVACYEIASFNTTTCVWDVTGTQQVQPTVACYETATFNTTTCVWDVTGTQATEPTELACYETSAFNTTTCVWDVTGTQPVEPSVACYQIATFNTTTCVWDVTGTQDPQPNVACYETATFNTTTCVWDVTGTQAAQPTVECYQTATFNTTSCEWDVTGTQATEPTELACYETTTFNTTSCTWEVSGSQPAQPTGLACYETSAFNTTSCVWDVSGSPITNITSISAAGSYSWSNNGQTYTSSGIYTGATVNCEIQVLNLTITPSSPSLALQVFFDGYYINSSNPAAMTAARYNNLVASGSTTPGAATDVDVITVELRSPYNLDVVAYSVSPILQTNGSAQCDFPAGALGGSYYIVVKHRATNPLWSANPITLTTSTTYNFANNLGSAYSDGDLSLAPMHTIVSSLYGIWLGELNEDGYLDATDYSNLELDIYASGYLGLYLLDGDLNGDTYVDASDFAVFESNSIYGPYEQRPYAITTNVSIGQSYQGGIVAYILQPGDIGYDATMQHGLIAAPSDQSTNSTWGCYGTLISGADGTAIGTGDENTIDIMNGCSEAGIAARLCGDLVLGGYSDWYLPGKDELNLLYINKVAVGGFANSLYWSSTEFNNVYAWVQLFGNGGQGHGNKNDYYNDYFHVRAVRSF